MTEAQVYDFSTSLEDQVQGITHRTEPSLKAALLPSPQACFLP